jgi:hypothetical protein
VDPPHASSVHRTPAPRHGAARFKAPAWLAALALGLAGCSLLTTTRGPAKGFPPPSRSVPGTALTDFKGVVHCHSYLSPDSDGAFATILAAARNVGLDFVVMTDHPTEDSVRDGKRGLDSGVLFVVGAELRVPGGRLLAFPLREHVAKRATLAEVLADIHAQGGLAMIAHAEHFADWDAPDLDGLEVVNLHAAAEAASRVQLVLCFLFTPIRSMLASLARRPDDNLAGLDRMLAQRRAPLAVVGGNDAHDNVRIGPLGIIGNYRELFSVLTTHVLATSLDEAALVEGFRAGRTYVAFDVHRDATGFDFRAVAEDRVFLPGDTVAAAPGLELSVRTPVPADIRLLRDGVLVKIASGSELSLAAPPPGVYRVECDRPGGYFWIASGAIRVVE